MTRFVITYLPELDVAPDVVEADSHELEDAFVVFYDEDGNATHRFTSSALLSVKPAD